MKLYEVKQHPKEKVKRHKAKKNRFYSQLDMSIIKHDAAVKNSGIKRGDRIDKPNNFIVVCGCGAVGCFLHVQYDNRN